MGSSSSKDEDSAPRDEKKASDWAGSPGVSRENDDEACPPFRPDTQAPASAPAFLSFFAKRRARKAAKRAKEAERREYERRRREEQEAAAAAYHAYVKAAETKYREAAASNDPNSRSNQLRASANQLYMDTKDAATAVIPEKLRRAEVLYRGALAAATTPLERCAALKNLAVVSRRKLALAGTDGAAALNLQVDALGFFVQALTCGCDCQTIAWADDLYRSASEVVDNALKWKSSEAVRERPLLAEGWPDQGTVLSRMHGALPRGSTSERSGHVATIQAELSLALAKHHYAEAVGIQQAGGTEQQWRRALDLALSVHPLFAEAARSARRAGNKELEEEAESMLEAVDITEAICRSVQARCTADSLVQRALCGSEELDMDGLRVAADFYHEAIVHARGRDLESEARARSALGRLYVRVLCMPERGLPHYRQVLELAMAMAPRVVTSTDWYREAREAVVRAQQQRVQAEEKAAQAEQATYLAGLAPELTALREAAEKGPAALLQHVYSEHPPPGRAQVTLTQADLSDNQIKDTLRRAIFAYHPDKQAGKPREWQVLSQEITKELNVKYGNIKCPS